MSIRDTRPVELTDVRAQLYERYLIHDTVPEALTTDQVPVTREYFDGFSLDVFWVRPCEKDGFMLDVLITDSRATSLCIFIWTLVMLGEFRLPSFQILLWLHH